MWTTEDAESAESGEGINRITGRVIRGAIDVHRALGPGLLESAYQECLAFELAGDGLRVVRQQQLPLVYKGAQLSCSYRLDLVVENIVVVEVKSVAAIDPIHQAQLLSYLRLSGYPVGLLINFNVKFLKQGIRRMIQTLPSSVVSAPSVVNKSRP